MACILLAIKVGVEGMLCKASQLLLGRKGGVFTRMIPGAVAVGVEEAVRPVTEAVDLRGTVTGSVVSVVAASAAAGVLDTEAADATEMQSISYIIHYLERRRTRFRFMTYEFEGNLFTNYQYDS